MKVKIYLLMAAVSAFVLTGCDSAIEPVEEESVVEEVVAEEENIEEAEPAEKELINAEKVAVLPIETVKIFEQIAVAYQDGDYIGACNFAKQLGVIGEAADRASALSELFNQLHTAGFTVREEPALIGTIYGTVGIHMNMNKYTMLYCGDYKEGKREGNGIVICLWLDYPSYAVGEWKDDMPNGKQNIHIENESGWRYDDSVDIAGIKIIECSGNVVNGLWNGEVNYNATGYVGEEVFDYQIYTANFENGKIKVLEQTDYNNVIAYGSAYNSYLNRKDDNVKFVDSSDKLYGCLWGYGENSNLPASLVWSN